MPKHPGQPRPTTPPSQSPDREEVVAIIGETKKTMGQQILFIQRDSAGNFTGFRTSQLPQFDEMEGRFARMMPPGEPGEKDALTAKMLLGAMGIVVTNAGFSLIWN